VKIQPYQLSALITNTSAFALCSGLTHMPMLADRFIFCSISSNG